MTTTPIQKCTLNMQQKFALKGKKITTAQAMEKCQKKFSVGNKKNKGKGLGNKSRTTK